jgi:uncharacterized protein YdaU (DUF1376 family)
VKIRRIDFSPDEWIAGTLGMSLEEEALYLRIVVRIYSHGGALPSNPEKLSRLCGVRPQVMRRILPKLMPKFIETGGKLTSNRCETEMKLARNRVESARSNGAKGGRPNGLAKPGGSVRVKANHQPSTINHQIKKDPPIMPPQGGDSASREFDGWWQECPRKVGKDAAARKYVIARRQADAETLLAGMRRYRASVSDKEPQFIVHPAAWLHQGRWKDEDAAAVNGHDSGPKEPPVITPELKEWIDKWHH